LLNAFLLSEGVSINDDVVVDEKQHHEQDIETLAISSYPNHIVTNKVAMTLFPGARSLEIVGQEQILMPLVKGSVSSKSIPIDKLGHDAEHSHHDQQENHSSEPKSASQQYQAQQAIAPTIVALKEATDRGGKLLVGGDADFLSNSYYPYLSNSALAVSIFRWAVGEQDKIKIEPNLPVLDTIVMSQPQMRLLFLLLVVGLPGTVLTFGVFVWWRNK